MSFAPLPIGRVKKALAVLAVAGISGIASQRAHAADVPLPANATLQDLINLTSGDTPSNGIIIGDKIFFDFSYVGSPTSGPNPAPTAAQISVAQAAGNQIGLTFSSSWQSALGFNEDSVIRYAVEVAPGVNSQIDGVGLRFNGFVFHGPNALTNATVTETVSTYQNGGPGDTLASLGTFDDGPGGQPDHLNDVVGFTPPQSAVFVTKDIQVHSNPSTDNPGLSTISFVDNTFHQTQVPEPASLAVLGLAGVGLLVRRRIA